MDACRWALSNDRPLRVGIVRCKSRSYSRCRPSGEALAHAKTVRLDLTVMAIEGCLAHGRPVSR